MRVWLVAAACTATAVLAYRRSTVQTSRSLDQKERLRGSKTPSKLGFGVVFDSKGSVTETSNASLSSKNVFSTPDLAAVFHKCAGRALRGGGFVTFVWPNQEGVLDTHVAFAYAGPKDTVVVVAEPKL